jgi:hypothetical protein
LPLLDLMHAHPFLDATTNDEIFAGPPNDPYLLAVRAYVWGFPLVEMAWIRLRGTNPDDPFADRPPTSTGAPLNRWGHQHVPADPTFRAGVGPSVDLLYSSLRLDLAHGPFVIEAPNCGSRYYAIQLAFADSAAEHSFGQRTHGPQLPPLLVEGPGDACPAPGGMLVVRSPTRYCLLPTRFLFDPGDRADLQRVRDLQRQLTVRSLEAFLDNSDQPPDVPDQRRLDDAVRPSDPLAFLHQLGNVLQDWHIQPADRHLIQQLGDIGVTAERGFEPAALTASARDEVVHGLRDGIEIVRRNSLRLGRQINGWTLNLRGPRFGDDWLLRAAVAKDQIVVTVPEEAIYPVGRVDTDGMPLHGANHYRIHFAGTDLPPVDAFWSVTLYGDDGFLVDNPLDRYALSDRTPGLLRQPDGGIDIDLTHIEPAQLVCNWLPAPDGPFYLMLRLYLPGPDALNGTWNPPPIERTDPP